MRLLITGATGFLGRPLCRRLLEGGHAVRVLGRDPERARSFLPGIERAYPWDARGAIPIEAFERVDAVVHLAGASIGGRMSAERKRMARESRIVGTRRLVDAMEALAARPAHFLCASATGYYGDRGDEKLDEASTPGSDFLANLCVEWEAEATRAEALGIRVARCRFGLVLDPGGGALGAMLPLYRFGLGGSLGSGSQWWPWIDREDLIALLVFLVESGQAGIVNGTAPEPVRQRDFARALGKALGRPARLPAPAFALRLALGDSASMLLASARVFARAACGLGFPYRYPDIGSALEAGLRRARTP